MFMNIKLLLCLCARPMLYHSGVYYLFIENVLILIKRYKYD